MSHGSLLGGEREWRRGKTCLVRDRGMSTVEEQKSWCRSVSIYRRNSDYYYKADFTKEL